MCSISPLSLYSFSFEFFSSMATKSKTLSDEAEAMLKWLEDPDDRSPTWVPTSRPASTMAQSNPAPPAKSSIAEERQIPAAAPIVILEVPKPQESEKPALNVENSRKTDSMEIGSIFSLKKELLATAEDAARQKLQYESAQGLLQLSHLLRISISTFARTTALRLKEVTESVQLGSSGSRSKPAAEEELLEPSEVNLSDKEKQDRITERNNRKLLTNDLIKDLYEANFKMSEELEKAVTFIQMFQAQLSAPGAGAARGRNSRR
jgi:hypothetical protein